MSYKTIREVVERCREFHTQVADYYEALHDEADKERIRMLLDYLSRHERNLEKGLASYESQAPEKVLNTWLSTVPELDIKGILDAANIQPDMTLQEILNLALDVDDCLIQLYTILAQKAETDDVRELFKTLLSFEEMEERNVVRDAIELEDL